MSNPLVIDGHQIDGVAFDLEGTVLNLESLHFAAHVESAKELGIPLDLNDAETVIELIPHFIGGPDRAVAAEIAYLAVQLGKLSETTPDVIHRIGEIKREKYIELRDSLDVIEPREGFLEFYHELISMGIPVAIGSLDTTADAKVLLQKSGLDKLFDPDKIILRENVREVKPDPEVYQLTAARMGIDTKRQAVFEDSHNGIKAAKDAGSLPYGMPTLSEIGIPTPLQQAVLKRMEDAGALKIFPNWREAHNFILPSKEGGIVTPEGGFYSPRERR